MFSQKVNIICYREGPSAPQIVLFVLLCGEGIRADPKDPGIHRIAEISGVICRGPAAVAAAALFHGEPLQNRRQGGKGKMNPIMINEEKCTGCALCVNDCPGACLFLENGKAHSVKAGCIECGHCYAICPQGAVRMTNYTCRDEAAVPMTELDSGTLLAAMRSRRTVRRFTKQAVEEDKIRKILEAGRYCPTGGNVQDVAYTVLGSRQPEAEAVCVGLFRKGQRLGAPLLSFLKRIRITDDFFFKGAPLVIVVSGKNDVDAALASSYMEIMAESLGLGVLYSGFFRICAGISRKLRRMLELPGGHRVVTCLVIGYPAVQYRRIVPRKEAQVKTL